MAKKTYVPALDGVRGIMPGILTLDDVEFEEDVPTSAPRISQKYQAPRGRAIPKHRRLMPCDNKKKDQFLSLFQGGTLVYKGSAFFINNLSLQINKNHYNN